MGRKPRPDYEGVWHHVMNRGANRQQVFFTARDAELFLRLLGDAARRFAVEIHAYCLMRNHFHLLVHCPERGLSDLMQLVAARYTRALNSRLGGDGPIFRGRFHSLLVDDQAYLDVVGRYIHRNPLDIQPQVRLDAYRWSSYGAYVGTARRPEWLHTDVLLETQAGRRGMRQFVEDDASCRIGSAVSWAIEAAVAEADLNVSGASTPRHLVRIVALLLLDTQGPDPFLDALVGAPTPSARRTAMSRARQRLADEPWLADVIERARQLAA